MVLKVFFRFRNIILFKRLLLIFYSYLFVVLSKVVLVENIGLKLDCDLVNKLLLFKYLFNWLKIIFN